MCVFDRGNILCLDMFGMRSSFLQKISPGYKKIVPVPTCGRLNQKKWGVQKDFTAIYILWGLKVLLLSEEIVVIRKDVRKSSESIINTVNLDKFGGSSSFFP